MSGLKLAVLYGLYPHQLGFCGPQEKSANQAFLSYLSGSKVSEKKIRELLKEFKGAYPYYRLIAQCSNIKDPFNEKAVRAYWVGNELLEKVSIDSLRKMIVREFSRPGLLSPKLAEKKAREIPSFSKPHHSFHVLVIGSITGRIVLQGDLLDFCRISWGKVKEIKNKQEISRLSAPRARNKAVIEYQPLVKNGEFQLAKSVKKEVRWERVFLPRLKLGDWVAVHWNYIIQVLSKKDLANLKKYTRLTIDSLNA